MLEKCQEISPKVSLLSCHFFCFWLFFDFYRGRLSASSWKRNSMRLAFNRAMESGSTMQFISTSHTSRCSVMGLKEAMRWNLKCSMKKMLVLNRILMHLSSQKGMEKGRDYPKCSIPRNKLIEIVNIRRYALLLMQFNFIIFRDVVYPNRQIPF
ncbi:uncharacterized protein LOC133880749 isoform X1 [Alnus glutinosa]|uniref:uncharacterized protein LOC133880749 isoform X1 n=1 Tax=Alnus glutinosa TaxID=3517 RepID=UPI002D77B1E7|nr:uncharacterized protein LOC133880749 isoform X1 [Alnus glutinosa]